MSRAARAHPALRVEPSGCGALSHELSADAGEHGAYYAFFSIHMRRNGHASASIGMLWALGVLAEVVVMFFPAS